MSLAAPLLEAAGITRRAGQRVLLDQVGLSVRVGERIALSGPSGSGKSLLLRSLALLDPVDAGEVLWRGSTVADSEVPAYRSRVVYLQQVPAFAAGTAGENLRRPFALSVHAERRFDTDLARSLLERLGRDAALLEAAVGDLSGGERQIVALLRVLLISPTILLLDEPTASLDAASQRRVVELVTDWASQDAERAYVWVTHDQGLGEKVSGRVISIEDGRLRARARR